MLRIIIDVTARKAKGFLGKLERNSLAGDLSFFMIYGSKVVKNKLISCLFFQFIIIVFWVICHTVSLCLIIGFTLLS